jgi:thiamine monophosphate synthase
MDASRAAEARKAGALGVAVTGTLLHADDPAAAVRDLRSALDGALPERS